MEITKYRTEMALTRVLLLRFLVTKFWKKEQSKTDIETVAGY